MDQTTPELELPGFRFHPTEEELLDFYLKNMIFGKGLPVDIIRLVNIYRHDPWELPGLARIGEREWYFFVPRDRKHGSGGRPNRTTEHGFWKATGSDRKIVSLSDHKKVLGLRKTLVFYKGRAPRGTKTDWVMNEYRLPDDSSLPKDMVLCKIYRKATSLKVLEQRAAMEEEMKAMNATASPPSPISSPMETNSFSSQYEDLSTPPMLSFRNVSMKKEEEEEEENIFTKFENEKDIFGEEHKLSASLKFPLGLEINMPELQVPKIIGDWTQDAFWTQFNSPWFQNLNLANALNS